MDAFGHFSEMAGHLMNPEIETWKESGGLVVGTVCSNIPEEIVLAAGILPLRLRAPQLSDTSNADSRLHRINCSYTRSVLELALRGDLDFLDGLITTNTCDHMLRLAGELQEMSKLRLVHYFSMYHTLGKPAQEWFVQEMRQLIQALEHSFGKQISDDDLRKSIGTYNRTRSLMRQINELRKKNQPPLSGAEYMSIVLAGMSIPREMFNRKLEELIPELEQRKSNSISRPRLMIIGGACDLPDFIEFIEQKGAVVVADALCFGMRHYDGSIPEQDDPLQAIAQRYTHKAACPSIMDASEHNLAIYRRMIQEWNVRAVVCARLKFCDHWAGARKLLADELRSDDIPLLDLEREYSTAGSGQISTRVQAFLEMLK